MTLAPPVVQYGDRLAAAGNHDAAIAQFTKVLKNEPNAPAVHIGLWNVFFRKGMYPEALEAAKKFFLLTGRPELAAALGERAADYVPAMRRAAETLTARSKVTYVAPTDIARLHAFAGESPSALQYLRAAVEQRDTRAVYIPADPAFDTLRRDERFRDVLRRIRAPRN